MTKDQKKSLSTLEKHFRTAKVGYLRGVLQSEIALIVKLYIDLGGDPQYNRPSCSHCLLKMVTFLAQKYDETK